MCYDFVPMLRGIQDTLQRQNTVLEARLEAGCYR
jgi:hypothetical protein